MSFPAARVGDVTVTGDSIAGPGVVNVFIGGLPAAVVGDYVFGGFCNGPITLGSSSVFIGGRPAARVNSQVTGINLASGTTVNTIVNLPGAPTVLIGG